MTPTEKSSAPAATAGAPPDHKKGDATPQTYLEIFAAILRDRRLSHGAFRLWHALRDYTNSSSQCFPGQRLLADDLNCDPHSLKAWTTQLVSADWLKVEGGSGRTGCEEGEGGTQVRVGESADSSDFM